MNNNKCIDEQQLSRLSLTLQEQLVVNSRGYTQETALSRRVKDWEDKITPELVLQVKLCRPGSS